MDTAVERVRRELLVQRELVARAKAGDPEAFAILARGAIERLHAVAYGILRDPDAADDAAQRALIDAWDHLASLRDPDRFDAWTYRLAVNAAYKEFRRERSQRRRVQFLAVAGAASEDPIADVAGREELERAFGELSAEHRAVLALHHLADLPLTEIAGILGIPAGTVGSRLHYATRKLRAALKPDAECVPIRGTRSDVRA